MILTGICPPCENGDHQFHRAFYTDLSNVVSLPTGGRRQRKVRRALGRTRRCECRTCATSDTVFDALLELGWTPRGANRKVRRVEWDGHEVTIFFEGSDEPFGEREFRDGTHTRRLFGALSDAIGGITKAYEATDDET